MSRRPECSPNSFWTSLGFTCTTRTFDVRLEGKYHSEGRDYSELFDALGSSTAPSLRQPQWAAYQANPAFSANCGTSTNPMISCLPRSIIDGNSQ